MITPVATPVPTAIGRITIVWLPGARGSPVKEIILPGIPGPVPGVAGQVQGGEPSDRRISALIFGLLRFLTGRDVQFDPGILDLDRCPPFQRSVLLAEYGIPRGYVSTYGRIARHIGSPGSARAVGNALARNPVPIVIPCHRAVRSDGGLGGFQGGVGMKRRLLEAEGIRFGRYDRVIMERVWYP